jgi:hypothetical protein
MKRTLLHGVPRGQTSFDLITLQTPVSEMQDQLGRRELLLREERVDGDFIRQHGLIHVCPAQLSARLGDWRLTVVGSPDCLPRWAVGMTI